MIDLIGTLRAFVPTLGAFCKIGPHMSRERSSGDDLTLLGHVAFVRKYAIELRALAHAAPNIAGKLRQIAANLDADADQIEKIARHAD